MGVVVMGTGFAHPGLGCEGEIQDGPKSWGASPSDTQRRRPAARTVAPMDQPRRVVVVGYPAAELLDIACVVTALQVANYLNGSALYHVSLASLGRAPIHTGT